MNRYTSLFFLPLAFLISSIGIQCSGDWNRKKELVEEGVAVVVLGIAQDAGYPQANCHKACCQPVWEGAAKPKYTACLALVDTEAEKVWMIDATPDFKEQLQLLQEKLPFTPDPFLDGIFLTHAHIGHYTGLMHLGREVMGASNMPVYAMPRMCDFLTQNGPWSQLVSLKNIELKALQADSSLQLTPTLTLTPVSVPHRDEFSETVGFRVQGPRRSFLFIPDIDKWEKWDRSILEELETVDLAFLDGTFFSNGEIPGRDMSEIPHPFMEESMALFEDLPRKKKATIHFIHFNHTNPVLRKGAEQWLVEEEGYHLARQGAVFPL